MFEYSKENRLLKNREFQTIYSDSSKWISASFVVLGRIVDSSIPRLGVVVSRKVGGAVTRNRIKRICREVFRYNKDQYPNLNVVVIARKGVATISNEVISSDVRLCLSRIYKKLLKPASFKECSYEK